jgi:hypothetical protein
MNEEELNMHEIPAPLAARAMGVPLRTVHFWLTTGELAGSQTITGRWWVPVGSCRELIRRRAKDGGRTEARFESTLRAGELPVSPFHTSNISTGMLISG